VLKELDEALSQQYLLTNQEITEGKNPHIKFKKSGGFTLATPKQEESDAEPLQHFFPDRRFVPLVEVLATVTASVTTWMNCSTPNSAITTAGPRKPRFMRE
jgi:hypothetical protein